MENIKDLINECEEDLKSLKNNRSDKSNLTLVYSRLRNIEAKLKLKERTEEVEELLNIVENLKFITQTMLDYCDEAVNER